MSDKRLIDMHPALDEFSRAVVKKANPGLSTFANNPENATGTCVVLLFGSSTLVSELNVDLN